MKTNKIKFGVMVLAASLTLGATSCKKKGCTDETANNYNAEATKDDGSCTFDDPTDPYLKTGHITANETWSAANVYTMSGKVIVDPGVTLTIQPGTIIKGEQGTGTNASALVISRGGMINANGTASQPIIFTSVLDDIQPGQLTGTNLTETDNGLWGGIIVLGSANVSAGDGDIVSQIEGIPATDSYGEFGGSDNADNSGVLNYISIRHGGVTIGAGNEINGLTLGGVGTGTTLSNIEVVANLDDGVEFFGGTVNASNILVGYQGDDGIDIDMNYSGTVNNFTVINGAASDEGLEIDGPEGSTHTGGMFSLMNGTVYIAGGGAANGDFKSLAQGTVTNVELGTAKIRASYQNACVDPKEDAFTHLTDVTPTLTFTTSEFTSVSVYTNSDDGAPTPTSCTVFAADQVAADGAMTSATNPGGDNSSFMSWTWTGVNNKW